MRLILVGSPGRMVSEISRLVEQESQDTVVGVFGRENRLNHHSDLSADLVIDFSTDGGFRDAIEFCKISGTPLLSGTTAVSESTFAQFDELSRIVPCLWSSNMSLGVAFINKLIEQFALLSDWDFQMEEIHHKLKKDRPSGTAITLQQTLERSLNKEIPAPLSIRGGSVIGIHRLVAMGQGEQIILEHQACDRKVFASGALRAAKWLLTQAPGRYSMAQLFQI